MQNHVFHITNLNPPMDKCILSCIGDTVSAKAADIVSATDYSPFGAPLVGRVFSSNAYRYNFNGKEKDDETYGDGNLYDYGFRVYNPRICKFLSVDPLMASYPFYTPYQFAGNKPIIAIDLDGLEEHIVVFTHDQNGRVSKIVVSTFKDLNGNSQDMQARDKNTGALLAKDNVLVIHKYPKGSPVYEHLTQLTDEMQSALENNNESRPVVNENRTVSGYNTKDFTTRNFEQGTFEWGVKKYEYATSKPKFQGRLVVLGAVFAQGRSNWDASTGALGSGLISFGRSLASQISNNPDVRSVNISMRQLVGLSATASVLSNIRSATNTAQNSLARIIREAVPSTVNVTTDFNINNRITTDPKQQGTNIQIR
jgi:RHS repeat-associated protein